MPNPLDLVNLPPLMERTRGRPEIVIGLVDGPVWLGHTDLAHENIRTIQRGRLASCADPQNSACVHGTFIAGILSAKRDSAAPAICPECSLLIRPIFSEISSGSELKTRTTADELTQAIIECVDAGVSLINISAAVILPSTDTDQKIIAEALSYSSRHGVLIVAAAGNQSIVGSSAITGHPWVISVAACDHFGRPFGKTNLGSSIGRRGLIAPGQDISSLGADNQTLTLSGTSAAAPFVTGTLALLWSEFPTASVTDLRRAITPNYSSRRSSVVPPKLDAWTAYQTLLNS
jgi:subtilisin family serine protease